MGDGATMYSPQAFYTAARYNVPVVFLVLPVTVLIAFWPGVIGLHLTTP